ncbi:FMN-binding negative transcriptional regulator [Sphingomonas sp. ac-8]|uniref:FMN-binding negative transcriptional regulator n=1 Tax=Sphingomonas sp. ac-8 TaxID=3242977 RepID=UPI003A801F69
MSSVAQPGAARAPAVNPFGMFDVGDVRALVEEFPLAWTMTPDGALAHASQLPLIGEYDADGRLVALIGHLARANPLARAMAAQCRINILFNGPSGYVSPEHAGRRNWAPTWNYAQLKIDAAVEIGAHLTSHSLDVLIGVTEHGRADPWQVREIADRYDVMAAAIIGFRARVLAVQGKFKLGQDEDAGTLHHILATHPDPVLVRWMRRLNAGR